MVFTAPQYSLFRHRVSAEKCNRERNKEGNKERATKSGNKEKTTNSRDERMGPCYSLGVHRGNRLWIVVAMCCSPFHGIHCWDTVFHLGKQQDRTNRETNREHNRDDNRE